MPPNNYKYSGDRIPITSASGAILGGALCVQEGIIGIADHALASGQAGTLWSRGAFNLAVPAGLVKGNPVYIAGDPPAETVSATLVASPDGATLVGVIVSDPAGGFADIDLGGQTAAQASTAGVQSITLAAPALASAARIATSANEANGASVIANASSADGLARNVTVTATQVGGSDDTFGTALVTGTDAQGNVITENLVGVNGSTVAGVKAFKTVVSIVQSGWTAGGTADTVTYGFGNKLGLPFALASTGKIILETLGGAVVAGTNHADGTIAGTTVDLSSGTYNATKDAVVAYSGA